MNVVAYCRVSTDKTDQLNSLEAQKKFFVEYAEKNNFNLIKVYADEGISGTKTKNRKEFLKLMRDAQHNIFDMLLVKDISRFARNTVDLLQNIRTLKALGIETTFLTSNMTVLGQSEFVITIFGALAQEESANMSKRIKFGKEINAKKGRVPNIVYGYDKKIGDYFNLEINKQEADVIRQIYDWYLNDGYGGNKIAQLLNERGLTTKRNCKWSQNAVIRILTNQLYTGKIINGKEEVTDFLTGIRKEKDESEWLVMDRPELRIIEPEQYQKVCNMLSKRYDKFKLYKERSSNKHLFSTLIKCKECGWSFRRFVHTYKNTYIRWGCSGHNRGIKSMPCPNAITIEEDELIQALEEYFSELVAHKKNFIENVNKEFIRIYRAKDENINYEKELRNDLAKLMKKKQKYMDMYTDDLISREELNESVGGLKKEIEKLESELKLIDYNLDKGDMLEQLIKEMFSKVEDIVSVRDMGNEKLKQIIEKIEVDKDGNVDIYLRLFSDMGLEQTFLVCDNYT